MIKLVWLQRAHDWMMKDIDEWGWTKWPNRHIQQMTFWYAATGQAIGHWTSAEAWLKCILNGNLRGVPPVRCQVWRSIQRHVPRLRAPWDKTAFGWFTYGNALRAWTILDDIAYIGPKIASWLLRDLSLLRDYALDEGRPELKWRSNERRDRAWFNHLPLEEQAIFVPLDRNVVREASKAGALPKNSKFERIQQDRTQYLQAAKRIAAWAATRQLDPRDLDIYWYGVGAGSLDRDGTPR